MLRPRVVSYLNTVLAINALDETDDYESFAEELRALWHTLEVIEARMTPEESAEVTNRAEGRQPKERCAARGGLHGRQCALEAGHSSQHLSEGCSWPGK